MQVYGICPGLNKKSGHAGYDGKIRWQIKIENKFRFKDFKSVFWLLLNY
jgi:hypothetical protein